MKNYMRIHVIFLIFTFLGAYVTSVLFIITDKSLILEHTHAFFLVLNHIQKGISFIIFILII